MPAVGLGVGGASEIVFFFFSILNRSQLLPWSLQTAWFTIDPSLIQYCAQFQTRIRANWGGGWHGEKQPKAGLAFYRASGFKMTALEGEMTQIIIGVAGGGEVTDIHSPVGWLWLGVEMQNLGREGVSTWKEKRQGMVFRYHPPLQVNHCSVSPALIPRIAKQDEVRQKPCAPPLLLHLPPRTEGRIPPRGAPRTPRGLS